jgi:hypothetical protein
MAITSRRTCLGYTGKTVKTGASQEIEMAGVVRKTTARFARWMTMFRASRYYDGFE